jgi:uncharacterized protein YciI
MIAAMAAWTKTGEGWRLNLKETDALEPSLPRLEIHERKETWVLCVLGPTSGRARTGSARSLEEAQRAALAEAQAFLDQEYQPLLSELLSQSRS